MKCLPYYDNFFMPLAPPNKIVYWECICKLFTVMDNQLYFGVEREVLVKELQYYFDQNAAADIVDEDAGDGDARSKANWMLRRQIRSSTSVLAWRKHS